MNEEKELTAEELEKATRETLRALSKKLAALAERPDILKIQVFYQEERPLVPHYEKGMPDHFLGLKQTGPRTLNLNIMDHARTGMIISAEDKR